MADQVITGLVYAASADFAILSARYIDMLASCLLRGFTLTGRLRSIFLLSIPPRPSSIFSRSQRHRSTSGRENELTSSR